MSCNSISKELQARLQYLIGTKELQARLEQHRSAESALWVPMPMGTQRDKSQTVSAFHGSCFQTRQWDSLSFRLCPSSNGPMKLKSWQFQIRSHAKARTHSWRASQGQLGQMPLKICFEPHSLRGYKYRWIVKLSSTSRKTLLQANTQEHNRAGSIPEKSPATSVWSRQRWRSSQKQGNCKESSPGVRFGLLCI